MIGLQFGLWLCFNSVEGLPGAADRTVTTAHSSPYTEQQTTMLKAQVLTMK